MAWTSSRSRITAPSLLLLRPIPRTAIGAPQTQRNRMSRTLRRLPSYKIPDESMPLISVFWESHKKRDLGRVCCLLSCGVHLRKRSSGFLELEGEINETAVPLVTRAAKSAQVFTSVSASFLCRYSCQSTIWPTSSPAEQPPQQRRRQQLRRLLLLPKRAHRRRILFQLSR